MKSQLHATTEPIKTQKLLILYYRALNMIIQQQKVQYK